MWFTERQKGEVEDRCQQQCRSTVKHSLMQKYCTCTCTHKLVLGVVCTISGSYLRGQVYLRCFGMCRRPVWDVLSFQFCNLTDPNHRFLRL